MERTRLSAEGRRVRPASVVRLFIQPVQFNSDNNLFLVEHLPTLTKQSCHDGGGKHAHIQSGSYGNSASSVILKASVRAHAARVIGLGLFLFGGLAYRSENRDVFGLWSWPYLAIVVISGALFLMAVAHSWTRSRQLNLDTYQPSIGSMCLELAVLMWGTGTFSTAWMHQGIGAR